MPNFKRHVQTGMAVGAIVGILKTFSDPDWDLGKLTRNGVIGAAGGYLGSMIPDKLEPATNPNHRSFFHSYTVGGFIMVGLVTNYSLPINHRLYSNSVFADTTKIGYLSHLYLDALTPKGLPLLKRKSLIKRKPRAYIKIKDSEAWQ